MWTPHEAISQGQQAGGQEEADAEEGGQEVSCFMPSPWTPRIPGAGWIAKEKWQHDEERRRQEATAKPAPVAGDPGPELLQEMLSGTRGKRSTRSNQPNHQPSVPAAASSTGAEG